MVYFKIYWKFYKLENFWPVLIVAIVYKIAQSDLLLTVGKRRGKQRNQASASDRYPFDAGQ